MGRKVSVGFVVLVLLNSCLRAAPAVDPCQIIQGLRSQMKQLKTVKAQYAVDSLYGPDKRPQKSHVTYAKDSDKYNIVENQIDPNGRNTLKRVVYDGVDLKLYIHVRDEPGQPRAAVLPADHKDVMFTDNDLLQVAEFHMVRPSRDVRYARFAYEYRGTEAVDGRNCLRIISVAPYLPGQKVFDHRWIEVSGTQYILRREVCLIDDKPEQLLYERQFSYDSAAGYPFPTRIAYRRYEIDPQGKPTLYYDKQIRVERIRINEPIDPCEFTFTFPEGTVVNIAPPTASPADLKNPGPYPIPEAKAAYDPNQTQPDPRTEFTLTKGEFPLVLPVRFGPRTWDFIVDTGSTLTIFDLSFRAQLGEPKRAIRMLSAGNPVVTQMFAAPRAFVGPFNIAECNEVMCAGLRNLAPILGREVHGMLGMDILKGHVVQIDFDEGRLAFLDDRQGDRPNWGQEFPITYDRMRLPQMKVSIEGRAEQDFTIDTGHGGSGTLEKSLFASVVADGNLKTTETAVATLGGTSKTSDVRLHRLTVGPLEYRSIIFTEGNGNQLGSDFLSRHVVTFDFLHDKLYLKKGKSFDRPDETGMCGVSLVRPDGQTVVYAVYEGCPAAKAGIKAGDVILKLQGRDAATYRMWEIRELFRSGDGKEITLTIRRAGETIDVSLRLERSV